MKRDISPLGLLLASVSAIIGSGWLFSEYYSAKIAGPAAIISWIIAGVAIICVAFVFAELCSMLPITGSSTRIPRFTHGTLVSFLYSWIIWLSYMALAPTEVQAVIQYAQFYFHGLTTSTGALTINGYITAASLLFVISIINTYSIRWLIKINSFFTYFKLIIPIFIAFLLIALYCTPHQIIHPVNSPFMPFGLHGIVYALAVGGIVFAFNGFKQAAEMAGEAKNPGFALPFAIIGSVVVCLIVFLALQVSFISALQPKNLQEGWHNLTLSGGICPLASIIHEHHLSWNLPILYFAAILAPLAACMMYVASSARSLYGISKCEQLPSFLKKINIHGNPVAAIATNFVIGMMMFAPLPGWDKMVAFLTSLLAITYGIAPVNLLALRSQIPNHHRPFRLPFVTIWATVAFYICNLLAYWSGWTIISKLAIALLTGMLVFFVYRLFSKEAYAIKLNLYAAVWIWPYFVGLILISYLGSFSQGLGVIPFGWDFVVIGIFSVFIMYLAMTFKLASKETEKYVMEHTTEP